VTSTTQSLSERISAPAEVRFPQPLAGVTWRPMTVEDVKPVFELRRLVGRVDHPSYSLSLEEIEHEITADELDRAHDTVIGIDTDGRAVAYGIVVLQPSQATLVRSAFEGHVHPDRRGEGLDEVLLDWLEDRGLQQLASSDRTLPGWFVTAVPRQAEDMLELLRGRGFDFRRNWFELVRDVTEPIPDIPFPAGARVETYGPQWAEQTRIARNDAFRDHFASQPLTSEEWLSHDSLPIARADLSYVVLMPDETGEEQVVAFAMTDINEHDWDQLGFRFGYIPYVGVRRDWRGMKLAPAVLSHLLNAYRDAGLVKAVLDVDADSPTGAVELYERIGFEKTSRSVSVLKEY